MLALPTSEWGPAPDDPAPPVAAPWRPSGEVEHVFTHFALTLRVLRAEQDCALPGVVWTPLDEAVEVVPSVFRKALRSR